MTFNATDLLGNSDASKATTSLVTGFTAGYSTNPQIALIAPAKSTQSGALTANTLAQIINIAGSGGIFWQLSYINIDATARTVRVKITIDGVVILDVTSGSSSTANYGAHFAGIGTTVSNSIIIPPLKFRSSFLLEVASSLTETNKTVFFLGYTLEA